MFLCWLLKMFVKREGALSAGDMKRLGAPVPPLIARDYSTSRKMAVMLIGSPVATMLMVAVVWPLLHFTN